MNTRGIAAAICLTAAGSTLIANAQLYFDDFNTGNDANWTRWEPPPATNTFGFPEISPGNSAYELAASPGTSSFFTTARAGSYVTGLNVDDFVIAADLVTWAASNEMQMGLMARVQTPIDNAGAFPGCYALFYINRFSVRSNGTDQLRILQLAPTAGNILNGNQGQFNVVAGGSASPQPGRAGYRLIFSGHANQLRGQIIDLSTGQFMTFNDGNGNLTDFIQGTDDDFTFATGSAGLITIPNTLTPGVDTVFDNFVASSTSIIQLYPPSATNAVGTSHTVCAVIIGVANEVPGVTVTFNVTNGPNATITGTSVTDSNGVACFTYVGAGGPGTDTIDVSYLDEEGPKSAFVTKVWVGVSNQPPVALCTNVTVSAVSNCLASASVDAGSYDPDGTNFSVVQIPPGPYPVGSNNVCLVVTDEQGASNVCCAVVTVVDTTPPAITCPGNLTVTNDAGQCSAVVNFLVTVTDCSLSSVSCDNPSGSAFPVGTTTVTCKAVDAAGNTNTCSFTVTVGDKEGPEVACRPAPNPSAKKIPISGKYENTGVNPASYWQLIAKDNCDPHPLLFLHDSASSFVAGPYNSGDIVKLSQNNGGTPVANPSTPPVVAHIHINGDALVYGVDSSGNQSSDPCTILIPGGPQY